MWFAIILVIIVVIFSVIFAKNYFHKKDLERESQLYTREKLQKMSVKELDNIYTDLTFTVMKNHDEPDSENIPFGIKTYGCKTWGEIRTFMDLVCSILNDKNKLIKMTKSQDGSVLTDVEKEKLEKMNKLDVVMVAYEQAKNGDAKSMMFIGMAYDLDLHIPKKAFYWMDKATKNGNFQAEYFLGTYYADGYGVAKDTTKGINLILSSASKGNKDAIDCCINKMNMSKEEMRKHAISI